MTDELWAAIGAGIRAQGRCIRIFDLRVDYHGGQRTPSITTPLRPRKRPNKHALAVLESGKIWDYIHLT